MKNTTKKLAVGLGTVALLASGCAHQYETNADFGGSVRDAIARQTINPAGVGRDGVSPGLDGASARATVDRYMKTSEQPPSSGDVFKVGVGSSASGLVSVPSAR